MMLKKYILFTFVIVSTIFTSCIGEDAYKNDPLGNFNQLWQIIDQHYCFLDYKQIDWNAVGNKYRKRISATMTDEGLFEVMDDMLAELQDGHVNLIAAHNQSRYDFWGDYPRNFNESLLEKDRYLGTNYRQAAGLKYKILDDNIGYIYYESFVHGIGEGNLDQVFSYLALCNGLIIDVRHNGGGNALMASRLASRFTNEKELTGYVSHKLSAKHNDFSTPHPLYLEPSSSIRWQKKVVVLTNRHSFSATNDFVNQMHGLPHVTLMGDKTGGGSGLPFSSELSNGWCVRFSACPFFDRALQHLEWGIEPDIHVDLAAEDEAKGIDTMIEKAREWLLKPID